MLPKRDVKKLSDFPLKKIEPDKDQAPSFPSK